MYAFILFTFLILSTCHPACHKSSHTYQTLPHLTCHQTLTNENISARLNNSMIIFSWQFVTYFTGSLRLWSSKRPRMNQALYMVRNTGHTTRGTYCGAHKAYCMMLDVRMTRDTQQRTRNAWRIYLCARPYAYNVLCILGEHKKETTMCNAQHREHNPCA